MPRIQLAHWHGQHRPGDELDVTAEELVAMRRDGRVAQVLDDTPQQASAAEPEETPAEPLAEASEEPEPEPARARRKR
jgi:hypothetical protein